MYSEDEYGVNNFVVVKQSEIMPQTLIVDDGLPVMDIDSLDDHNHVEGVSIYEVIFVLIVCFKIS